MTKLIILAHKQKISFDNMENMIEEFKKFVSRGNVIELAVGLIMATYFGAIVKSFVNDIIMPAVGPL